MTRPLISIVVPAYNHERFIGAAIESVFDQTVDDLELVVVDDGSTDRTAEVVQSYNDPRLSYTWQEHQDAFNTINRGMEMARGRFIAILNSDDIYTSNRLERCLEQARQNQSQCLFTDVIPISDEGDEFTDPEFGWNVWHRDNREYYRRFNDLYIGFLHGNFMVTTSNLFMAVEAVEKVGKFCSLRYLHDYDYMFRMMLAFPSQVEYLEDEKLLFYRIHQGNTLSEAAITGRMQDLELINRYMLEKLPPSCHQLVQTGTDRLRTLENELHQVRSELVGTAAGVTVYRRLLSRARSKVSRMLGTRS
jgi:glycosyltransferase involved in cell wall biosynthesis